MRGNWTSVPFAWLVDYFQTKKILWRTRQRIGSGELNRWRVYPSVQGSRLSTPKVRMRVSELGRCLVWSCPCCSHQREALLETGEGQSLVFQNSSVHWRTWALAELEFWMPGVSKTTQSAPHVSGASTWRRSTAFPLYLRSKLWPKEVGSLA